MRALDTSIIRNWRKGDPCYIWQKFWLTVTWEATCKVQLGFFLMLSIKCEGKKDKSRGKLFIKKLKEPGLVIWEILILSRYQKMLKIRGSFSRKHALEIKCDNFCYLIKSQWSE